MPESILPPKELWDESRVERYVKMYGDPREKKGSQSQLCKDIAVSIKPYTVLDVGCGIGHLVPFIAPEIKYTGLDKSPYMLALAREFFPNRHFVEDDATAFDWGCGYDTVASVSLLLHLSEGQAVKALVCMWRHVAPGGRLVVGMETLGNRIEERKSGLIIRNQKIDDFIKVLQTIAAGEKVKITWSHQKIVYQTISDIIFSKYAHKFISHQQIARTTIFIMEKAS